MPVALSSIIRSTLARSLLLALLYYALGRLALWLAIPPGYAMAIYPPAGLALGALLVFGYRMVGGVAAGSLALNLWIGYQNSHSFSATSVLVASAIAAGAGLQAIFGRWLIRRFVPFPLTLDSNSAILGFMLLGGPVACLVNASVGVGTLFALGIMPLDNLLPNWTTWWAGDALGVFIVAPICLILAGEPAQIWRSRRFNVLLPLLLILCAMTTAFLFVREWEQMRFAKEFREDAQRLANSMQTRLDYYIDLQKSVVSLFTSVGAVSQQQFSSFVSHPVANYPAIEAMHWAPRIPHAARSMFEQQMQQGGLTDFSITEQQGAQWVAAAARSDYYPQTYVEPQLGNEKSLGFDIGSEWSRRGALYDARDLGLPVASEPVRIGQPARLASVLVSAVYDKRLPTGTKTERQKAIIGAVVTILRMGEALDSLIRGADRSNMLFHMRDAVQPQAYFDSMNKLAAAPLFVSQLNFAGRELIFSAHPTPAYLAQHQSWAAWSTMVGGMLFVGLSGMYMLYVSGRAHAIETLVKRRTRELYESEHRLHAILDNAAEGILTFNAQGQIQLANRAAQQLLDGGDGGGDGLQQSKFSQLFHEADQPMQLDKLLPDDGHVMCECLALRMDGSRFDIGLSLARLKQDGHGLYIAIIHDLTEKKRVERLKGEFVSAVSHELRTPLTSIRGSLGLLVGGVAGSLPDSAKKLLRLANENAERLSTLINDILDFEKLEYGGMLFKMESLPLLSLLDNALTINQGYAEKFSIKLVLLRTLPEPVRVRVDSDRLIQVLSNLISNAIKFSHAHGQVEIEARLAGQAVQIWVIDHGIGIPDAFRQQIFKKFSQADGSERRKYAGTGLGLSLAKSMMEKMGGNIDFDSVEGQGARFYLTLPFDCTPFEEVKP
jgi:PAS domain S-box-containing protein